MPKFSRPSPALVVATIALFVAAGGGAWAAGHARSAHRAPAHGARVAHRPAAGVRGPRGPRGFTGHTGPRGRTGPQGPVGPSDGFVIRVPQSQPLAAGNDTTVAQLSLPAGGTYILNASTTLGNVGATDTPVSCTLLQNSNPLGDGSADLPGKTIFAATITLPAAVSSNNGANIKLSCNPDSQLNARNSIITAIAVGTLHTQTPTTP